MTDVEISHLLPHPERGAVAVVAPGADITALARSAGAAGRSWSEFCCEDVVQDFVCEHDGRDTDLDAWRTAHDAGWVEYLAAQGWVSRWTTAPTDYDCFGTTTAEQCGDWHGKPLRRILCHPHHAGYQESRNGSGMHPTWDVDPRVEEREAAERRERWQAEDAAREARRAAGLAWLASATEAEIDDAQERDEVHSRGLKYTELRAELERRADEREAAKRAETWKRCRAAFEDGAILVDEGTAGQRGVYGWVPGQPARIYYNVRVVEHWAHPGDAEQAVVVGGERGIAPAGSLEYVANWIATGRYRVLTDSSGVPPEPVVRRIGHEHWKDILRVDVAGRTVWVGRASGAYDLLVLDAAGRLARSKAVRDGAVAAFHARERASYASSAR